MAGGKAAGLEGGVLHKVKGGAPMANLHLDLIHRMGVDLESFGDSTGRLPIA